LLQHLVATIGELREQSLSDTLTGLPNRRAVEAALDAAVPKAQREGRTLLVALVDVDGLKAINDRLGHRAGDALLVETAGRLVGTVRRGDLVGRWGGDEFVLVCPDVESEDADTIVERLHALGTDPLPVGADHRLPCGVSAGCALLAEDSTSESILAAADAALYRDKGRRSGRRSSRRRPLTGRGLRNAIGDIPAGATYVDGDPARPNAGSLM
jgi:diguanylate cyclase (GGDEF)-like protein